ncbi:MAG: Crp/Fnr family transcriptional regulator [Coriobacteriia bacterium]|nr:Crp/Fnr family transcriptional regulator [Coriobacteriia bacterium]
MREDDFEAIAHAKTSLLQGVPPEKRHKVLACMNAKLIHFEKGSSLSNNWDAPLGTIYLLKGHVRIDCLSASGDRSILFDYFNDMPIMTCNVPKIFSSDDVRIIALEDCTVISFDFSQEAENRTCCMKYINTVRKNIVCRLNLVNSLFLHRIDILSRRTIRSKIASYLTVLAQYKQSNTFEIQMTRQELADYLCVERSALSREIGKMKHEELIDCVKGHFRIKKDLSSFI